MISDETQAKHVRWTPWMLGGLGLTLALTGRRAMSRQARQQRWLARRVPDAQVGAHCYFSPRTLHVWAQQVHLGDYVRLGERVSLSCGSITLQEHVSFGTDVIVTGAHARLVCGSFTSVGSRSVFLLESEGRFQTLSHMAWGHVPPFDTSAWQEARAAHPMAPTHCVVGHDVCIGLGSVILPNVMIGDGALIGAGSVIREDVPPYAIMVGNPASVLMYRFKPQVIQDLLALRWWDWPLDKLERNRAWFMRPASLWNRLSLNDVRD